MSHLCEHIKLTKKEKKAVAFLLSLPGLARKIIGAPRVAQTLWESKICISHENGPNPMNHPESLWITQCWKNATPFFPQNLMIALEKSTLDGAFMGNERAHNAIGNSVPAIVQFYNHAQKMRKEMSMTVKNPS
jgi:hypothetical protein